MTLEILTIMKSRILAVISVVVIVSGCNPKPGSDAARNQSESLQPMTFTSEPAPEWTALMERTSGWFGADGIFSIPLDGIEDQQNKDKKTLFIFSDTYIGEVKDNVPQAGNVMVNNTTAWMSGIIPERQAIVFEYKTVTAARPPISLLITVTAPKESTSGWATDSSIMPEKIHFTSLHIMCTKQVQMSLISKLPMLPS